MDYQGVVTEDVPLWGSNPAGGSFTSYACCVEAHGQENRRTTCTDTDLGLRLNHFLHM